MLSAGFPHPCASNPVRPSEHAVPGAGCGEAKAVEEIWTMLVVGPLAGAALSRIEWHRQS